MTRSPERKERFQRCTDFLVSLGTDNVPHTKTPFLAHLIGVYRDLEAWGCDEELCLAGLFHSIYGTELFQRFALPVERRDDIRELIGERAERLAHLYCFMERASFDKCLDQDADHAMTHRVSGERVPLDPQDYDDLCTLQLCDWLEQVPRSEKWDYRRESWRKMAERLGGTAKENFERVYAAAG